MPCLKIINNDVSLFHPTIRKCKRKIQNCNTNKYFNQRRLHKNISPNLAVIKIPNTSPASKSIQHKASMTGMKHEIKYVH